MVELNPVVDAVLVDYGVGGVTLVKAFWLVVLWFLLPHITGWKQALLALASLVYFALTLLHIWFLSPLI